MEDRQNGQPQDGGTQDGKQNGGTQSGRVRIKPRDHAKDPRATVNLYGFWYAPEEVEEVERQYDEQRRLYRQDLKAKWLATPQGRLCRELYDKFREYKQYLEENEHARRRPDGAKLDFEEHELFKEALRLVSDYEEERAERDRKNLEKAQLAARCEHRHTDGERCGSPRVKGKKLCYMHERLEEAAAIKLDLGPMEDPDSIQVGIRKLQSAVIDGTLDYKQIGHLSYLIQLAVQNVGRTSMANRMLEEME